MKLFKKNSVKTADLVALRKASVLADDTSFEIKEAYNSVRTNIMFSLPNDDKCKVIIITSPSPGEGKTTTAVNISITLALAGSKVLLVDADMRKPKIHTYMDVKNKTGLSGLLSNFTPLKEVVNHSSKYYLDFITAGIIPPNPTELLSSEEAHKTINGLKDHYDYIIIDTPPVNVVTDAVTLSKLADGLIIVTRQNVTTHQSIARAISNLEFADAKILGFILNDSKKEAYYKRNYYKKNYGYSYGYGYGYSYGYGYGRTGEENL